MRQGNVKESEKRQVKDGMGQETKKSEGKEKNHRTRGDRTYPL